MNIEIKGKIMLNEIIKKEYKNTIGFYSCGTYRNNKSKQNTNLFFGMTTVWQDFIFLDFRSHSIVPRAYSWLFI